jgi:CdiI immunity protein
MSHPYVDCYPYLDALVGGWFHQDFDIDGDTLEEIIASYKRKSPPDDLLGTKADINRFIRQTPDERIDEEFARRFEADVDPRRWSQTTRHWLLRIYDLL